MNFRFHRSIGKTSSGAFTLVEMMVSMAVLALLMAMISQLLNSATSISTQSNKHMDGDAQARAVFDRMAIDFAQIVKRPDVDYYLKDPVTTQMGNDQLACYSQVPGYNASTTTSTQQSPVSLVAYRVNSDKNNPYYNQLERLGYGLAWNGSAAPTDLPVVFSAASTTTLPNTISSNWLNATGMGKDLAYEEPIGPEVFRMEYYYILRGQTISVTGALAASILPSQLSATPWDTGVPAPFTSHTSVNGLQDVAAITVVIAVIDPKSRALVSNDQLIALAATMQDFSSGMKPGDLENKWQLAINSAAGIPKIAASSIRVYRRDFYLPQINPNP
jgi:prepilin-type N-terminal cleavage/methylation domain-containing protein